ncbi:MAG: MFS transporter [Rubrivivax sp.]|nr:MFS transporter [Rubrivivax sp.]
MQGAGEAERPLHRQREYMLLWGSQVVSNFGAHASGIIYPLLILALTGSPAQASWATALRIVPYLLLSLPVGALIDRWDRRRVMLACHVGRAAVVASLPVAMVAGVLTVQQIYVVAVLEGVLMVFFNIAETAALPRVVPLVQLPQATAQNQAGFAAASIAGPALGTWVYQAAGRAWPFVIDVATHVASAWMIRSLRTSMAPSAVPRRDLRAEIAEGIRWLLRERLVRDMAVLTSVSNFISAAVPLLMIVRAQETGASEAQIGLAFSLGGIGGIVGALLGGHVKQRWPFGRVIVGIFVLQALVFPLFGWAGSAFTLGLVYAALVFFGPIYNVVQFSHRIARIPDALQGRVNSSFRLVAHGLNPVGAVVCGQLLERAGSGWAVAFFAVCSAALAVAAAADRVVRTEGESAAGRP